MTPLGFVPEPLTIALDRILPSRRIPEGLYGSRKFKQIQASIDAVGLIEPLIVGQADKSGQHVLLDGHIRLLVLREIEFADAPCLVATDDESRPRRASRTLEDAGTMFSQETLIREKLLRQADGVALMTSEVVANRLMAQMVSETFAQHQPIFVVKCDEALVESAVVEPGQTEPIPWVDPLFGMACPRKNMASNK